MRRTGLTVSQKPLLARGITLLESRRDQEKQERRDSILDAAEAMFFSKGYERCSMDEIARSARISRPLIYVYFKDKAALMRGVALRAGAALQLEFEGALEQGQNGLEQIENIGRAYYRFSVTQPDYFDVLTQIQGFIRPDDDDEQSLTLLERSGVMMQLLVQALTTGISDGTLCAQRIEQPLTTAYYLRGAMHGVIMQCRQLEALSLPDHPAPEALVEHTLSMLSRSMKR